MSFFDGDDSMSIVSGAVGGFVAGATGALAAPLVGGFGSAVLVAGGSAAVGNVVTQSSDKILTGKNFVPSDIGKAAVLDGITAGSLRATGLDRIATKWASNQIDRSLTSGSKYVSDLISAGSKRNVIDNSADSILDSLVEFERKSYKINELVPTASSGIFTNEVNRRYFSNSLFPVSKGR